MWFLFVLGGVLFVGFCWFLWGFFFFLGGGGGNVVAVFFWGGGEVGVVVGME